MMNYPMENRGENKSSPKKKKNHFDFRTKKDNTLRSLKEVEYFLNDFKRIAKHIKLYRLLK